MVRSSEYTPQTEHIHMRIYMCTHGYVHLYIYTHLFTFIYVAIDMEVLTFPNTYACICMRAELRVYVVANLIALALCVCARVHVCLQKDGWMDRYIDR